MPPKKHILPKAKRNYLIIDNKGHLVNEFDDFMAAYDHFRACYFGAKLFRRRDEALLATKGKYLQDVDRG